MAFGNILIIIICTYYISYFVSLILPQNRKGIQLTNVALEKIRKIKYKTLEEQKQFINLRYPKRQNKKWKFSWKKTFYIIIQFAIFIIIFRLFLFLFEKFNIFIPIWLAIIIIIVFPMIINLILEKFNLQKTDLRLFLR